MCSSDLDSDLDWAFLSATGGHPGLKPDQAVVRRWTVTEPTDVRVRGMLKHTNEQGNGVRGSIIVRGKEKLGEWTVHNTVATTMVESIQVAPGDTIDFVTDCLGDTNSDTFEWKVRLLSSDESLVRSSSEREFSSAQPVVMTIWEQAAQALLLTNEFCFID